jgi:hypothetical protein
LWIEQERRRGHQKRGPSAGARATNRYYIVDPCRAVVDDELLAKHFREALRENARENVGSPARSERRHDAHGPVRPFLRCGVIDRCNAHGDRRYRCGSERPNLAGKAAHHFHHSIHFNILGPSANESLSKRDW